MDVVQKLVFEKLCDEVLSLLTQKKSADFVVDWVNQKIKFYFNDFATELYKYAKN
jgi:hypothetical protein